MASLSRGTCSVSRICRITSKPKKNDMLVAFYEVTEEPKVERHNTGMGSTHGVPIRVCRGRLTSACNPGMCDCADTECQMRKSKISILWMLAKLGVFGFAIEEAFRYGIWSDAGETAELTERYTDWAKDFFPTMNKTDRSYQEIYDMARIRYNMKNAWNSSVIGFNNFLAYIPELVCNLQKMISDFAAKKKTESQK